MSGIRWTEEQLRAFRERRKVTHWPRDVQESLASTEREHPLVVNNAREHSIWLPWPPSVNTYWRHPNKGNAAGKHLISERGRQFRQDVMSHTSTPLGGALEGRLQMTLILYPPDQRQRDIDNFLKGPLDALRYAGVYLDDSQIRRLFIDFAEPHKPGRLHVHIKEITR